jgi:hypothetical protein
MALFGQTMLVEFWRWSYKDSITGHVCRTAVHMTADEVRIYPEARRIRGTLEFRELEIDFTQRPSRELLPPVEPRRSGQT